MVGIKVYGADWCHDTQNTLKHLKELGLEFTYANVDKDEQAKHWVRSHNEGKQKLPTVDVSGRVLSVPNNVALDQVLREKGMLT
ncbi:MAG TPA: glutaredoxin family protein [Tepidisphaeraceae bacterium]|jgi:glutaredoxin|nr:glutaredoxin family protein [Tepidisphaeraceae bacterium]